VQDARSIRSRSRSARRRPVRPFGTEQSRSTRISRQRQEDLRILSGAADYTAFFHRARRGGGASRRNTLYLAGAAKSEG